MVRTGSVVVVVDSVEEAVRFYTEKLAFDLIDVSIPSGVGNQGLASAHLKKAKTIIVFRAPAVEESVEFSFIKRCASRCVGIEIEVKRGLDKLYQRCQKKGIKILKELYSLPNGKKAFSIRDLFGMKICFIEPPSRGLSSEKMDFAGLSIKRSDIPKKLSDQTAIIDKIAAKLKVFGISRRSSKKLAKIKIKDFLKN